MTLKILKLLPILITQLTCAAFASQLKPVTKLKDAQIASYIEPNESSKTLIIQDQQTRQYFVWDLEGAYKIREFSERPISITRDGEYMFTGPDANDQYSYQSVRTGHVFYRTVLEPNVYGFSRDGKYVSMRNGNSPFIIESQTGHIVLSGYNGETGEVSFYLFPLFSKDGTKILAKGPESNKVIDIDTKKTVCETNLGQVNYGPQTSPDGLKMFNVAQDVVVADIANCSTLHLPIPKPEGLCFNSVNPDASAAIFTHCDHDGVPDGKESAFFDLQSQKHLYTVLGIKAQFSQDAQSFVTFDQSIAKEKVATARIYEAASGTHLLSFEASALVTHTSDLKIFLVGQNSKSRLYDTIHGSWSNEVEGDPGYFLRNKRDVLTYSGSDLMIWQIK